jgi:hypothetical protein
MANDPLAAIDDQLLELRARLNVVQTAVAFLLGDEELRGKLTAFRHQALAATDAALERQPPSERRERYRKLCHDTINSVFSEPDSGEAVPHRGH